MLELAILLMTYLVGVSIKLPKEHSVCEKKVYLEFATCSCENGKYVGTAINLKTRQKELQEKPV